MSTVSEPLLLDAFLRHQSEIRQFLARKVSCPTAADDLTQETYLRIARYRGGEEILDLRAFLFRIANNLALDYLRGLARSEARDYGPVEDSIACWAPQPDSAVAAQQQLARMERFIYALPQQCRTVFLACRVDGKSYAEIADELNISPRTVEAHMYKAIKLLKERMDWL
ncbi:RNA polymerase sigma factor [Methylomonas sp. CM2]|uniref:RNA polymerase sigma factor n=1 Tax=Methylomonas sp. CM2 TaxID=3417647 RepID=UPI003CF73588